MGQGVTEQATAENHKTRMEGWKASSGDREGRLRHKRKWTERSGTKSNGDLFTEKK